MITIGFSTREHNPKFIEYLKKSSGYKKIEVIEKINNGEKSLPQVYNEILEESKTDIVVLCHDDIYFDTTGWFHKIEKHFEKSDYGILGVAGVTSLTDSGRWWDERKKMVGIVNHESEGKKWESKYSESFENKIIQTLVVDGLFFAVHKKRIKKSFDEDFKGFHFYDTSFSFSNHLEGVKVGVITNIRITHKSIGMTNEQWEQNRMQFVNKFKDNLPAIVKRTIYKGQRFKINLSSLSFNYESIKDKMLTEIAIGLKKLGHDVTITTILNPVMNKIVQKHGIKIYHLQEPPGFKLGDGKWVLNTPNGPIPSVEKTLYKVQDINFDIIHVFNDELIDQYNKLYPDNDIINTQFVDGLFISDIENDKVVKTIKLTTDLDNVKNPETINKIISEYIKTL